MSPSGFPANWGLEEHGGSRPSDEPPLGPEDQPRLLATQVSNTIPWAVAPWVPLAGTD